MPALPYISAMLKEVLRWRPSQLLFPQHQSTDDIDYNLPVGTEFMINSIAISCDYDDPDVFKPERFLDGNESSILHGHWAFGGRRRVCVGYKVAQTQLFVVFARLIYCFDYSAVRQGVVT